MHIHSDKVLVAIKCPSLDCDSVEMAFQADASVLHVKETIEHTWRGAPRAHGMRCIRAGRLLRDHEVLRDMASDLQPNEALSLHLVIRPDAWTDPHNRPTTSRRTSYIRQQADRTLPHNPPEPVPYTTVFDSSASSTPTFAPFFNDTIQLSNLQDKDADQKLREASLPDATDHDVAAISYRIEQTIRITAPENYSILTDALAKAYDEYLVSYEIIYNASFKQQAGERSDEAVGAPRKVLDLVEGPLFGWSPIDVLSSVSATKADADVDATHHYSQVTYHGLPYLLRLRSSSLALQRSEALCQLLERMSALRKMLAKIDNLVTLGSFIHRSPSQPSPILHADTEASLNQQRTRMDYLRIMLNTTRTGLGHVTMQDLAEVAVHVFFLVLRVSILLYIVVRHADPLKKFFVLGMTGVYVAFESWRILLRRLRARQPPPQINRPATPIPPAAGARDAEPAATDTPAGSNVPRTSVDEEQVDRQVAEEPSRPLPPPRLPARHRATSTLTLDFLIEHMSYIGLDMEDAQLGLLTRERSRPASDTAGWSHTLYRHMVLPILLFLFTMVPEVEQRRKRAIQERERVIRKWTRLEQERKTNLAQLQSQQRQPHGESAVAQSGAVMADDDLNRRRKAYADQILRRRTGASADTTQAADADDEEAIQQALHGPEENDLPLDFF